MIPTRGPAAPPELGRIHDLLHGLLHCEACDIRVC
jgi:hypothetical protein